MTANGLTWWLTFLAAALVGLGGDVAMKKAGLGGGVHVPWLAAGFVLYSATGLGWFWLLRTRTLSSFGTIYPLTNAVGLLVIGAVVFGETIERRQWVGFALGCAALWLLAE